MRYAAYLVCYLVLQLVTWVLITPFLPLFAVERLGPINNGNGTWTGPRLPLWLAWFDTPDNNLDGDQNHFNRYIHFPAYLRHLFWLYRNSLYGFKWTVLAYEYRPGWTFVWTSGNPDVNRNNGITGSYHCITNDGHWQWKLVRKLVGDWGIMWNFGWQLDSLVPLGRGGKALFQFSPRFVRII